jgi:acetylornithine deacetylase/succinyl-diaminopimelate desuccinylase-like protein
MRMMSRAMGWKRAALALLLGSTVVSGAPRREEELSEAAGWLQRYLRVDTTNPPGDEHRAAALLGEILRREAIPTRLLVTPQGRTNLYARLSSPHSGGRALVLLHHMDVVSAGPGWKLPPFSGRVQEGVLWGRGAIDDKSLGIAQLAAFVAAERKGRPLARDLIYLAVADEENGGLAGTGWLLRQHPELFRGVEAVMGEGGRSHVVGERLLWWGIEVAQKRPLWVEVTTTGRGGHASSLNLHSASHKLVGGLSRVLSMPQHWRVSAPARQYLHAIAPLHNDLWKRTFSNIDEVVEDGGPKSFLLPGMANLFLDTIQVTVLSAGRRINVIPATARAQLDIRLLPDTDAPALLEEIRRRLGNGFEVKVLLSPGAAAASPPSGRFYEALRAELGHEAPVVPTFIPGFTDSRFFRERGIAAYGVSPFSIAPEAAAGIHGPNERIPLSELDRGVERTVRIVAAYAGLKK